ncbi:golgin candidate 1-like isoform X2 [Carya illinoinensis]|uniref:golgin candidate 1-like isoform X2 n=1 Tax=Carya illinoinensis TaxID=32201 RepID=UPI001C71FF98|nr:golgin candidate 1-like isoform X2 [Carya illinoinensis]
MASWLKAAEGLFEVVDRRAKLVVSELSDEQSDSQSAAANGQGSHAKRKSKTKSQKKVPRIESDTSQDQTSAMMPLVDVKPENDMAVQLVENDGTPTISISQTNNVQEHNIEKDSPLVGIPPTERPVSDVVENNDRHMEVPSILTDVEAVSSTSNGELVNENASDVPNEHPFLSLPAEKVEIFNEDIPNDASQSIKSGDTDVKLKIDLESSQSVSTDFPRNSDTQLKDAVIKVEPLVDQKRQQELKVDDSQMKVQEQLDEAQGLLKTTVSTGQSKEARLARVCAGLSSRLQEYKSENAQLEELLISERELSKSFEAHMKQLQQDLSESKSEVSRVESNMVEALAAKNSEIEALVSSLDTLKKQAASSEGNLASLQAVREELASVERRAEDERAAHNATKMAAMEREVELEHRAVEASTALARIQRIADERTAKAAELEQKVALLEVECASLNQELQDMEARARRGQKKSLDEANQMIQMQAWQEEVERARQGQRDAEGKLSSLEAEVQKMRVEMAAMRRDAEHYSRQEHMELEKRYRELTDLLYCKQTQLEAMVSEKAAAEFQLEKEKKRIQEVQVEVERSRVSRRALTTWEEDTEIKALEPLPLYHRHMVGASLQLQKAAKLLDSGAVRATRFLWRYPTARVILLFYLVFVHFFLMYLLHRLQAQADSLDAREVAESMGLADPTLP